jgi:hypothetical protein
VAIGLAAVLIAAAAAFAAIRLGSSSGLWSAACNRNHRRVIGVVEAHPARPGAVVLRNVSQDDWTMTRDGEAPVTAPPQQRLDVRTMVIDFGPARAGSTPTRQRAR